MKKIKIAISLILVISWMILIFSFSSMPGDESHGTSKGIIKTAVKVENKVTEKVKSSTSGDVKNEIDTNTKKNNVKKVNSFANKYDGLIRKSAHAFEYFILDLLILNFLFCIRKDKKILFFIVSILICFLYACTDEFHQKFVECRSSLFSDALIDTCGSVLGAGVFGIGFFVCKKNRKLKKMKS